LPNQDTYLVKIFHALIETIGILMSGFPRGIESIEKVWNCEIGFQDIEKVYVRKVLKKWKPSLQRSVYSFSVLHR